MAADPTTSSWAPFIGAALGSLVTGGALVFQSWLADRRARRSKVEDDRRAREAKHADQLLTARASWAACYQTTFFALRAVAMARALEKACPPEYMRKFLDERERLYQEASRLALVERNPQFRRMVRLLTMHLGISDDEPKRDMERIGQIAGLSHTFVDLLVDDDNGKDFQEAVASLSVILFDDSTRQVEATKFVIEGKPAATISTVGISPSVPSAIEGSTPSPEGDDPLAAASEIVRKAK